MLSKEIICTFNIYCLPMYQNLLRLWRCKEETLPFSSKTTQALEFQKSLRLRFILLFCGFIPTEKQPGEDELRSKYTQKHITSMTQSAWQRNGKMGHSKVYLSFLSRLSSRGKSPLGQEDHAKVGLLHSGKKWVKKHIPW